MLGGFARATVAEARRKATHAANVWTRLSSFGKSERFMSVFSSFFGTRIHAGVPAAIGTGRGRGAAPPPLHSQAAGSRARRVPRSRCDAGVRDAGPQSTG